MFQRWKDNDNEVTWGKILDVCDDFSLGRTRRNIYLSSEEAHDKYLDRPDKEVSSSSGMKHIFMHKRTE